MADSFRAIHTYSDPGLDKQKFIDCELSVRLSTDAFTYTILDGETGKFLHLESFDLAEPGRKTFIPGDKESLNTGRLVDLLENTLGWLSGQFSKTRILLEWGSATLVPEALFKVEEQGKIFDFNVAGGPYPENELRHDHLKPLNAYNIYHLPARIESIINRFFPTAKIYHHSTSILQSIFQKYINIENEKLLHVNAAASRLDILRFKGKKLEYFNSFRYNTAEDFMYYLIFVVEQLGLNPESVEVIMSGEADKHSALTDLLLKYVRNVQFIKRNDDFRYSFVFDQLPGHYYFNLLNASLCE